NSTFVSVFEPYRNTPFIKAVQRLYDGNGEAVAVKIEKVDGSIDYVLYNASSQKSLKLANGISMTGSIGYLKEKDGKVLKGVLVNASALDYRNMDLRSSGPIKGKVVKMNKELAGGGWILVDSELPI